MHQMEIFILLQDTNNVSFSTACLKDFPDIGFSQISLSEGYIIYNLFSWKYSKCVIF